MPMGRPEESCEDRGASMRRTHRARLRCPYENLRRSFRWTLCTSLGSLEDLCDDRDVDCAGVYGGSKQTRRGEVARTEPRTEPTITPVWLEWEDDLPMTGTDDVVEGGGEDDEAEVGIVGEVVGGEVGVGVEGRVGDVAEGSADVEEGIAGVEGSADVEEGVAGVEDGKAAQHTPRPHRYLEGSEIKDMLMSVSRAGAGGAGTGAAGVRRKENVDSNSQETRQKREIEMSGKERGDVQIEGSPAPLDPIRLSSLKFNTTWCRIRCRRTLYGNHLRTRHHDGGGVNAASISKRQDKDS
ncbi:hypothetical protein V8E53_015634 [Lactarius tabidus]